MEELTAQLRGLLDSPGELQRLAQTAQALLGGEGAAEDKGTTDAGAGAVLPAPGSLLPAGNGPGGKAALIEALAPYLSEARRSRLRRAASLARAARLAETLLAQQNGAAP